MDLQSPLTFEILYNDASVVQLREMGIEPKITDCSTEPVEFFSIDCITPIEYEDGIKRCTIYSSGQMFNTEMGFDAARMLIIQHLKINKP